MSSGQKARLDQRVVDQGWARDLREARAMILAGKVRVPGVSTVTAGMTLDVERPLEWVEGPAFVSRGGVKLRGALDHFSISAAGRSCMDVGASTGGFTDCLLKDGAARVLALDVGKGLLDWGLRNDPRVVVREKTHVLKWLRSEVEAFLSLTVSGNETRAPLAVVDVSFISLKKLWPHLFSIWPVGTEVVALVKPQFEVEAKDVPGGIVVDEEVRARILEEVEQAAEFAGFILQGRCPSPIHGADGNKEFFLWLRRP